MPDHALKNSKRGARERTGQIKPSQRRNRATPIMDQPFEASIANVRLAVKLLRKAALSPIPDLAEVAPDQFHGFGAWVPLPQYPDATGNKDAVANWERKRAELEANVAAWDRKHCWSDKARKKISEAFDWRDNLTRRIGSTSIENRRARDPEWDDERLAEELGYIVVNSKPDELHEGWGPPESLLGEFYEQDVFSTSGRHRLHVPIKFADMVRLLVAAELVKPGAIQVDTEDFQPQPFWEISPHISRNDCARAFLGPPPRHLTDPQNHKRIDRRIRAAAENRYLEEHEFIHPYKWWQYVDVVMQQCLLERARALELCAWCDQRIEAWRSAYYPVIYIGPKRKARNRTLRVLLAGQEVKLPKDTIADAHAERLLRLRGGKQVSFKHRNSQTFLIDAIPPLSGLLRNTGKTTGPTTQGGVYSLPPEVQIIEGKPEE